MATFQDTYTRLLRIINRPSTETDVLAEAKSAINDAVIALQRIHAFNYTESLATIVYPANTLHVSLGDDVCGGKLRDIVSIQEVISGTQFGKPLKIKTLSQLQGDRNAYARLHSTDNTTEYSPTQPGYTIEDGYRSDYIVFLVGQNLGLYPTPTAAVNLVIHLHIWLPQLVNSLDSNFFLDYAQDLVLYKALKMMHLVMKVDNRYIMTDAQVKESIEELKNWDSQVTETPNTSIG